jgi:membrane-bound inhibitor of C-type lysozyme
MLLTAALSQGACAPSEQAADGSQSFQCGEFLVSATFSDVLGVALVFDGRKLALPGVPAGSGAKYADDSGNEFWTKGQAEGMLTLAGEPRRDCRAVE